MDFVTECCKLAYDNKGYIASLDSESKNKMLAIAADAIVKNSDKIIAANKIDLKNSEGKPAYFLDRLMLNSLRIEDMATGLKKLCELADPIGEITEKWTVKNGLTIQKVRVPLGVLGIIFEARPNVSIDAVGLCIKSGNSVVLRGSRDAIESNKALVGVVKASIEANGYNVDFIQLVLDTTHEGASVLMKCRKYVDVLLPRGSADFIKTVVENSTVSVIETGAGNCHCYVEKTADFDMAANIILNGKLQRPSVCNALESLLIDRDIAKEFLPFIAKILTQKNVELVGCEESCLISDKVLAAIEDDFYKEFNALKISVKIVNGVEEAINHINKYSTKHSDVIITKNAKASELFLNMVDSAVVYVNASTRFTDGFEFGFGAEMGISTQKLHARGPLGLKQLTSEKYEVFGNGQIR